MEECHGGELFDRILEHIENEEMYTEKEASRNNKASYVSCRILS